MTKPVLYGIVGGTIGLVALGGLVFWLRSRSIEEGSLALPSSSSTQVNDIPKTGQAPWAGVEAQKAIDADLDGITDDREKGLGTDVFKADSDGDGFSDYEEIELMKTDPLKPDAAKASGRPGLDNYQGPGTSTPDTRPIEEIRGSGSVGSSASTSPEVVTVGSGPLDDPDKDGMANQDEQTIGTNPRVADSDRDGLSDGDEVKKYKTNPLNPDSDNDGFYDAQEIEKGYNPLGSGMCKNSACIPS